MDLGFRLQSHSATLKKYKLKLEIVDLQRIFSPNNKFYIKVDERQRKF